MKKLLLLLFAQGKKNGGSVFAHPGYAGTRREGFDTSEAK